MPYFPWYVVCGDLPMAKNLKWIALNGTQTSATLLLPFTPQQPPFYCTFLLAATIIFLYGPKHAQTHLNSSVNGHLSHHAYHDPFSFCLLLLFLVRYQLKRHFIFFLPCSAACFCSLNFPWSVVSPIHPLPWPASTVFSILPSPHPVAILPPLYLSPTLTICLIFSSFSLFSVPLSSTLIYYFLSPGSDLVRRHNWPSKILGSNAYNIF